MGTGSSKKDDPRRPRTSSVSGLGPPRGRTYSLSSLSSAFAAVTNPGSSMEEMEAKQGLATVLGESDSSWLTEFEKVLRLNARQPTEQKASDLELATLHNIFKALADVEDEKGRHLSKEQFVRLYRCVDKKASEQLVETAFKTIQNPSFEDLTETGMEDHISEASFILVILRCLKGTLHQRASILFKLFASTGENCMSMLEFQTMMLRCDHRLKKACKEGTSELVGSVGGLVQDTGFEWLLEVRPSPEVENEVSPTSRSGKSERDLDDVHAGGVAEEDSSITMSKIREAFENLDRNENNRVQYDTWSLWAINDHWYFMYLFYFARDIILACLGVQAGLIPFKLTETHSTFRVRLKDFRAFNLYGKDNKQVNAVIEGDFGGWKFETRILHRVINPVWPFSNIFVYRCPMAVMRDRFFTLSVYDFNRFGSKPNLIGECRLNLYDVATGPSCYDLPLMNGDKVTGRIVFTCEMAEIADVTFHFSQTELSIGDHSWSTDELEVDAQWEGSNQGKRDTHREIWSRGTRSVVVLQATLQELLEESIRIRVRSTNPEDAVRKPKRQNNVAMEDDQVLASVRLRVAKLVFQHRMVSSNASSDKIPPLVLDLDESKGEAQTKSIDLNRRVSGILSTLKENEGSTSNAPSPGSTVEIMIDEEVQELSRGVARPIGRIKSSVSISTTLCITQMGAGVSTGDRVIHAYPLIKGNADEQTIRSLVVLINTVIRPKSKKADVSSAMGRTAYLERLCYALVAPRFVYSSDEHMWSTLESMFDLWDHLLNNVETYQYKEKVYALKLLRMVMERDEMDFNMSYEIRNRFRDLLRATFEFVKEKLHQNYMFREMRDFCSRSLAVLYFRLGGLGPILLNSIEAAINDMEAQSQRLLSPPSRMSSVPTPDSEAQSTALSRGGVLSVPDPSWFQLPNFTVQSLLHAVSHSIEPSTPPSVRPIAKGWVTDDRALTPTTLRAISRCGLAEIDASFSPLCSAAQYYVFSFRRVVSPIFNYSNSLSWANTQPYGSSLDFVVEEDDITAMQATPPSPTAHPPLQTGSSLRNLNVVSRETLQGAESWIQNFAKNDEMMAVFISHWVSYINRKARPSSHMLWCQVQGYIPIMNSMLKKLGSIPPRTWGNDLTDCSASSLANSTMIDPLVHILFSSTNVFATHSSLTAVDILDRWLCSMQTLDVNLPSELNKHYFIAGLTALIESESFHILSRALFFLYAHIRLMHGEMRRQLILNLLIKTHFLRLFLHWAQPTRWIFHTLIQYKLGLPALMHRLLPQYHSSPDSPLLYPSDMSIDQEIADSIESYLELVYKVQDDMKNSRVSRDPNCGDDEPIAHAFDGLAITRSMMPYIDDSLKEFEACKKDFGEWKRALAADEQKDREQQEKREKDDKTKEETLPVPMPILYPDLEFTLYPPTDLESTTD